MKKTNKKNSTARKLLPAFAMLTVSAISLSSATYAWFTMNKTVNVTNMQVKAKAEKGLLINEVAAIDSTTWDELATSTADTNFTLIPMSTLDGVNWNHANSTKANDSGKASSATEKGENLTSTGYEIYGLATSLILLIQPRLQVLRLKLMFTIWKRTVQWVQSAMLMTELL